MSGTGGVTGSEHVVHADLTYTVKQNDDHNSATIKFSNGDTFVIRIYSKNAGGSGQGVEHNWKEVVDKTVAYLKESGVLLQAVEHAHINIKDKKITGKLKGDSGADKELGNLNKEGAKALGEVAKPILGVASPAISPQESARDAKARQVEYLKGQLQHLREVTADPIQKANGQWEMGTPTFRKSYNSSQFSAKVKLMTSTYSNYQDFKKQLDELDKKLASSSGENQSTRASPEVDIRAVNPPKETLAAAAPAEAARGVVGSSSSSSPIADVHSEKLKRLENNLELAKKDLVKTEEKLNNSKMEVTKRIGPDGQKLVAWSFGRMGTTYVTSEDRFQFSLKRTKENVVRFQKEVKDIQAEIEAVKAEAAKASSPPQVQGKKKKGAELG